MKCIGVQVSQVVGLISGSQVFWMGLKTEVPAS